MQKETTQRRVMGPGAAGSEPAAARPLLNPYRGVVAVLPFKSRHVIPLPLLAREDARRAEGVLRRRQERVNDAIKALWPVPAEMPQGAAMDDFKALAKQDLKRLRVARALREMISGPLEGGAL